MSSIRWSAATGLVLVASLFTVGQAEAQTPIHLSAGPTFGTISADDFETESSVGFFAAVGTSVMLSEKFAVSPYLAYVQKGAEVEGESASYDYIEVPVLFNTGFPVGERMAVVVFAGPQFGFQINCDEDGFDCTEFSNHKGTEFGLVGGAGLRVSPRLAINAGADIGLTNLFDELDYKTRTFFLSLQYTLNMGGGNGM